jgi:hypothetical protein
MKTMSLICNEE